MVTDEQIEAILKTQEVTEVTDFLRKFSYRGYEGEMEARWKRILHIIKFEVVSTWHRSRLGKVLIVMTLITNFIGVIAAVSINAGADESTYRDALNGFIAEYFNLGDNIIKSSSVPTMLDFSMNVGILLIILFGIAGSGMFADDKQGKVIEIYLSRLQKREYVIGKILSIIVYINLFVMIPLLVTGFLFVQGLGQNHLEYIGFYLGIMALSLIVSLLLGLSILTLSAFVEKRSYASMIYFLVFLILTLVGFGVDTASNIESNELILLINPSSLIVLIAFICLGDLDLGIIDWSSGTARELILNDGTGLEYWHVLGLTFMIIGLFSLVLGYKIKRLTSEEL